MKSVSLPEKKTLTTLQSLLLRVSSSGGLYATGASLCILLCNVLPLIGPHQSWRSGALGELGPLTLNMWFCGSGHRHLLTHSVEIRRSLQLGISETIVTNKKLVTEWKLCILSQGSCRNITIPDKFLCGILAALTGASSFNTDNKNSSLIHTHLFLSSGTAVVLSDQEKYIFDSCSLWVFYYSSWAKKVLKWIKKNPPHSCDKVRLWNSGK